jgi:RHS repeat-associated protein
MSTSTQGPGPCCPPDCPTCCCGGNSDNPIRYFSGRILLRETDLDAGIPGFSHSRIFFNRNFELIDWESAQGWNWAVNEWPYLVKRVHTFPGGSQETLVLKDGLFPLWFDLQEDESLSARYGAGDRNSLTHLPSEGIYRFRSVTNGSIETLDFHDFTQPASMAGMLRRRVDANGFETTVLGYGDKTILGLQTVRGEATFRMHYAYFGSGPFEDKIETVTLESEAGGITTPLRRVRYLYYDGTTSEGGEGDLKAAVTQQPAAGTGWEDIEVRYYRYTVTGRHLLTHVVGPTVFMKLKEFGQDVLTMPVSAGGQDLVPQFCNNIFEYDSVNRVIREVARGSAASTGPEGVSYERFRNPNLPNNQHTPRTQAEFNTWAWKIIEEGRPGYRTIVYTNKIGQPLATVKQSLANPDRQWITALQRGGDSGVILEASPAAVTRLDETLPDLIGYREGDGSFANLRADSGLITRTEYYTETTATASAAGGVTGYTKATFLQNGWQGALIPQSSAKYLASDNVTGPVTYAVAEETTYRLEEDTPESRVTISHSYAWYAPAGEVPPRIREKTTTYPAVPIGEGGDGGAHITREIYDESGNLLWEMDRRGLLTKREYEVARGLLIREVQDADTAPPGWSVLPGPHLALTTDHAYDGLSRLVRTLGPEHEAMVDSAAETLRRAEFFCHVDAPLEGQPLFGHPVWNQVRMANGYRLSSSGDEEIVNPVRIELKDKCGRVVHALSSRRSTGAGALAPTDTFLRADWSRWQANFYERRGLLSATRVYHAIPAAPGGLEGVFEMVGVEGENYDETLYRYAEESPLLLAQRDPEGTVTRTLYDEIERPVATYVGTNDTPDCSSEPWFPGAPGTDLVLVSFQEYDLGQSGGNSLLTLRADAVSEEETRLTKSLYDFRGRVVAVDGEESRYAETTYDNLNRPIENRLRNGSADGTLIALELTFFNKLSQPYEVRRHDVDPLTGAVGGFLSGRRVYDPNGNLLESTEPGQGGRTTWRTYDTLNRPTETRIGCRIPDGGSEIDLDVEKSVTVYDAASNAVEQSGSQLDAGAPATAPTFRTSYAQFWFDPLGRPIASAALGALTAPPSRTATPPTRSDTCLVSETIYNDRGEVSANRDPLDRENRFSYDDKGRRLVSIENYVAPGVPVDTDSGINRTQRFAYTPDDQLRQLVVVLAEPSGEILQITRWDYGVTLDDAWIASRRLLARKVYADGTADIFSYNRQSEVILRTDANGTVHRLIPDGLGRLRHDCALAIGEKIHSPTRRQSTFFDPRGLLVSAQAHNSPDPLTPTAINEVALAYDGLGSLVGHIQEHAGSAVLSGPAASKAVRYEREGLAANQNRVTVITSPSGRQFRLGYGPADGLDDRLGRVAAVQEITSGGDVILANYEYLGLATLVRKTLPEPELALDLWGGAPGVYEGLDLFSRIIDQRWTASPADAARIQYGYDRGSRRPWRLDAAARSAGKDFDELYAYDGLGQVTSLRRGELNAARTDLEPGTETFNETWTYDSIGNWAAYSQGDPAPALAQTRSHNSVNEITRFERTAGANWIKPRHDEVGNTTRLPGVNDPAEPFRVDYDAWNRPSRVFTFNPDWKKQRVALYVYDARGWRVQSAHYSGTHLLTTEDFYYDENWRNLEEWTTAAPTPPSSEFPYWTYHPAKFHAGYLWDQAPGLYPDSLILRDRDTTGDGEADERLYALQDAHFNVVAVADETGAVVERFAYSGFGSPLFLDAGFEPVLASAHAWEYLFSCYQHERRSGLYYVRNRFYHPAMGRWISRDPIGEEGGVNLYAFVDNDGVDFADPDGLFKAPPMRSPPVRHRPGSNPNPILGPFTPPPPYRPWRPPPRVVPDIPPSRDPRKTPVQDPPPDRRSGSENVMVVQLQQGTRVHLWSQAAVAPPYPGVTTLQINTLMARMNGDTKSSFTKPGQQGLYSAIIKMSQLIKGYAPFGTSASGNINRTKFMDRDCEWRVDLENKSGTNLRR